MNSFLKNLGVLLIIVGALLLILPSLIPAMVDLLDYNAYTVTGCALVIVGFFAHILLNKYLPLAADGSAEAGDDEN